MPHVNPLLLPNPLGDANELVRNQVFRRGAHQFPWPQKPTAGTYGSATKSPVIVADAFGRITSISEATITGASSYPFSFTAPVLGNFTQALQAGAAISTQGDTIRFTDLTGAAGPYVSQVYRTFAAGKQAEIAFTWIPDLSAVTYAGIGFRESGTGKLFYFWPTTAAGQDPTLYATSFTSPTTGQSNPASETLTGKRMTGGFYILRVKYDGTNLLCWMDCGKLNFDRRMILGTTFPATTYFTTAPDQISIAINCDAASKNEMQWVHFAEA